MPMHTFFEVSASIDQNLKAALGLVDCKFIIYVYVAKMCSKVAVQTRLLPQG